MRPIIEARLEGGETSETEATIVAVVERKDRSVADLGLTLAEGRALLAEVQSLLVSEQTAGWMENQLACHCCGSMLTPTPRRPGVCRPCQRSRRFIRPPGSTSPCSGCWPLFRLRSGSLARVGGCRSGLPASSAQCRRCWSCCGSFQNGASSKTGVAGGSHGSSRFLPEFLCYCASFRLWWIGWKPICRRLHRPLPLCHPSHDLPLPGNLFLHLLRFRLLGQQRQVQPRRSSQWDCWAASRLWRPRWRRSWASSLQVC